MLSSVRLHITKGEKLAIYGHGGSGKSLLLKFLYGKKVEELSYSWDRFENTFDGATYLNFNRRTEFNEPLPSGESELLLIDEPEHHFSISDFNTYHNRNSAGKRTLIFVTHHLEFLAKSSDRVLVLKHGKALGVYPTEEFFNNDDPYIQYLSTMGC